MATGIVKWFNNEKGYGFVLIDNEPEGQNEVFVHHSAIDMQGFKSLRRGQRVEFSLYYGHKGLTASYLRPLNEADGEAYKNGVTTDAATPFLSGT